MNVIMRYAYICQFCGKQAFYTNIRPKRGELLKSEDFFNPDGSIPKRSSDIICSICDNPLPKMYVENIVDIGTYKHKNIDSV